MDARRALDAQRARANDRRRRADGRPRAGAAFADGRERDLKIAFFGLPLAALLLDADGHDVVHAGICRRNAIGTRRLTKRLRGRVDVAPNLSDDKSAAAIERAEPDLIVSWFWTKKIPNRILSIPKLGSIGVHPSLLPRHRGPDPYFWTIDSGDRETGVTAHRLDEEYDTGEILDQIALAVDPEWSAWTLARKLDRPSLALLRRTVATIAKSGKIDARPQNEADATNAPAPTDEDLHLSFEWPADKIVRRVRAASPWPGTFFDFGGRLITVVEAYVTHDFPKALACGEAALVDGRVVVRAFDAAVAIDAARDENDEILDLDALRAFFGSIVEVEKKRI